MPELAEVEYFRKQWLPALVLTDPRMFGRILFSKMKRLPACWAMRPPDILSAGARSGNRPLYPEMNGCPDSEDRKSMIQPECA